MKELEDTNCEIRRIVELPSSIWDRLNSESDDEQSPGYRSNDAFEPTKPLGGFLDGTNHAWLSCGTRLIVLNVRTGENISSWNFRHKISSVSPFPIQPGQLPLLLVGLDNGAHRIKESVGMVCVFDCTTSRILRIIRVPCGVEEVCVISGGTEWEELCDQRTATILGSNSGIACVALRNFDYLIIDLQRSSWDSVNSYLVSDEQSPYEIEFPNSKTSASSSRRSCNREKHAAYSLINNRIEKFIGFNRDTFESMALSEDKFTTSIINSKKIGCLLSGCLGRVMLWQSDGSIGWISPQFDENMSVSHLALIEPADDPRSFYYLWIACEDDSGCAAPVLRMYAMLFEKKYHQNENFFRLESDPSLKFEIELDEGDTISCLLPIERETNMDQSESGARKGEESLLLIGTNNRMLLFDLNQWYKEQMPITVSECQNPNSILASYRTRSEIPNSVRDVIISAVYVPSSIKEFVSSGPNTLEELFFPNSLSYEWIELTANQITFWLTRGVQSDLLRKIVVTGPVTLIQPADIFHRCIAAGLIPFNTDCSFNSDHNAQREMLLSLCLEQRWAYFLVKCAKEWSDGSASYLFPAFIRWGVQRGTSIKIYADQLSIPLFDQSGNNIGESETKILRFCCQQLECLSTVMSKLNVESPDFIMQQRALRRVATYFQVLLWFHDVGLLPETQEVDESNLKIALSLRIPYPYQRLTVLYKEKREKLRARRNSPEDDNLFIDNLITRECLSLRSQWEREGVDVRSVGQYPPPSLQSLLRSYLADCHQSESNELENKHQITIYFLMDLAMILQGSCPSIDQLIKYPAAFKLSPSLIKLTQAFWLLDHEDYQGFLDMMTGQLVSESDIKDWHHKLVIKTLVHDKQHKLALMYLRLRKPPLMTLEEQGTAISLSVEYGLVQSAFHCRPSSHYSQLLMRFFRACKSYGKLPEILHLALDKEEEEAFIRFLEEDKCEETKLLYYLQRSRHTEASSVSSLSRFAPHLEQPVSLNMFKAYNCTLPNITRRFTTNLNRKNSDLDPDMRYPRPMSHAKSYNRAQEIHEIVMKKAKETFNRGERTQVPFVSAPCMSLRTYPPSSDVNCVLFMERKKPVKRTIYQMQGNEDIVEVSEKKRIKLSDDQGKKGEKNKSLRDKSLRNKSLGDKSELGIEALFTTPLVKRKSQFIKPVNTPLETPHSILKIRQLIRESNSPNLNISPTFENADLHSEKKPRQIRFSVSQIQDDSMQSESTGKQSNNTTRDINDTKEVIDEEASEVSEDTFFSPSISIKSEESTILSDCSSSYAEFGSRNVSGPRPRPGLKRRNLLSSNDSSRRTSKTASTSSDTPTSLSFSSKQARYSPTDSIEMNVGKSPKPKNPLLTSVYSTSILSDSSYDENSRKFDETGKGLEWDVENSISEKDLSKSGRVTRVSQSISVTRVSKTLVEQIEFDDEEEDKVEEVVKQVDENVDTSKREKTDDEETEKSKSCNKSVIEQDIDKTIVMESDNYSTNEEEEDEEEEEMHNEKSVSEKLLEANGAVMVHLEEKLDECGKVSGIHEDTNRNILHEGTVMSMEDHHSHSEDENDLGDDSSEDLELLALANEEGNKENIEEDNAEDNEEVYESLSNTLNSDVTHSLSTIDKSTLSKQAFMENSGFLQLVEGEFNITDDESVEVLNQSSSEEDDKSIQDEEKDYNITEDESDEIIAKQLKNQVQGLTENLISHSNEFSKLYSDSLSNRSNDISCSERINQEKPIKEVSTLKVSLQRTPVRETRSRRASSIVKEAVSENIITEPAVIDISDIQTISSDFKKDTVSESNISREKTPVRETRFQNALFTTKDTLASQENIIEKSLDVPDTPKISDSSRNNEKRSTPREKTPLLEPRAQKSLSTKENLLCESKNIVEESLPSVLETEQMSHDLKEDKVTKISSLREKTPIRETRSQKTLPMRKDSLASQDGLTFEEGPSTPRRSGRASSVSKIMEKTEGFSLDVERNDIEKNVRRSKTPVTEIKLRSESQNEQIEEVETEKMQTKRGSSLTKEILMSSVELGNKKGICETSTESKISVEDVPKRSRPQKSQEASLSQEVEKEPEEASASTRRNTQKVQEASVSQGTEKATEEASMTAKKTTRKVRETSASQEAEKMTEEASTTAKRTTRKVREVPILQEKEKDPEEVSTTTRLNTQNIEEASTSQETEKEPEETTTRRKRRKTPEVSSSQETEKEPEELSTTTTKKKTRKAQEASLSQETEKEPEELPTTTARKKTRKAQEVAQETEKESKELSTTTKARKNTRKVQEASLSQETEKKPKELSTTTTRKNARKVQEASLSQETEKEPEELSTTTTRKNTRKAQEASLSQETEKKPEELSTTTTRKNTRKAQEASLSQETEKEPEELLAVTTRKNTRKNQEMSLSQETEKEPEKASTKVRKNPRKVQETTFLQEVEKELEDASTTMRRNTRRGTSLQRELTIIEENVPKKQKSMIDDPIEMDISDSLKRSTRSRRANSVTMDISLPRLTRGASVSKELLDQSEGTPVRQTRRRGGSVPKEITLLPSKTKRSANVSEVINEELSDMKEDSRVNNLSSTNTVTTHEINIPPTRKRTRCPSVQSIPEEVEEILSLPSRSMSTRNDEKKEILSRSRRAASVDLTIETKHYTRSTRLKQPVLKDAILEEPTETEETKTNSKVVTKQPSRRKRAASESVSSEKKEELETKSIVEKPRRGRKVSQKTDDTNAEFAFSPPQKTSAPKDKKGISEVPNYVFSPPHTRSKQTSQPRRFISFIPTLTEEEKQEAALLKAAEAEKISNENQDNIELSRNPILRFVPTKFTPRTAFSLNNSKKREK